MRSLLRSLTGHAAALWRIGLLALAAALIWVAHYQRWTAESWRVPTDYYIDAHETLARLKAASEGELWPLQSQVIDRLGAPFGAYWNAYPTPDKPLMVALGGLVHVVGLYAAANLGLVLAQVLSALAFYFVARWLRCRWEWAAAGALLFAYTYHTVHRGLSHFSLVFTWTVPLGLLAVWLVAGSRRLEWHRAGAIVCLFAAAALGVSNPYNLFFWLQLMGWALIFQWFGLRRWPNLQIGLAAIATALVAFGIVQAEAWLYVEDTGGLPLLARNYAGTEMYALKPVEMFIPPTFHHWGWLAFFGERYTRWSSWRGEIFLPYIGLAGIAGFLWLVLATIQRIIARRPPPGQALSLGWIMAYATIGGITNLLALFTGFQIFRATNRVAIFISAIVLFFLVTRLSRVSGGWPRWLRLGVAAAVAGLGVFEQLPRLEDDVKWQTLAPTIEGDRQLGRWLEAELPDGAMVFQLPVIGFPEVATPNMLNDYEHFRPYLATETLRFSYGAAKTRARSRWQREVEAEPPPQMVAELERAGFAALYINRRGYRDQAEGLLRELAEIGYTRRMEGPQGNQVVVMLRPSEHPRPPLARSFTFGQGWHIRPDNGVRWAYERAALSYFNPYPHPLLVDLRLALVAVTPREVVLELAAHPLHRAAVGTAVTTVVVPGVSLAPGVNLFTLHSPAPATRQGAGPNLLRSFGLRNSVVEMSAPDDGNVPAARTNPPRKTGVVGL